MAVSVRVLTITRAQCGERDSGPPVVCGQGMRFRHGDVTMSISPPLSVASLAASVHRGSDASSPLVGHPPVAGQTLAPGDSSLIGVIL